MVFYPAGGCPAPVCISAVNRDDGVVTLSDGSRWQVGPGDLRTVAGCIVLVPWDLLLGRFGAAGAATERKAVGLCEANRPELERMVSERLDAAGGAPAPGFISLR